jgi:hypothetical protein
MAELTFDKLTNDLNINIRNEYSEIIELIKSNIEKQSDLIFLYANASYDHSHDDKLAKTAFGAVYKNCVSLYSILELTLQGLYGPARVIFRNIYEYLVLSKTVSIINDNTLLNKWENGEAISLRKHVFNRMLKPKSNELMELWDLFNKYTHGTIYSQQICLEYNSIKIEIQFNLVCIIMLLDMNYHVVNSCIANNSIQYHTRYYMDDIEFKQIKRTIRTQVKIIREVLPDALKRAISDFNSTWILK